MIDTVLGAGQLTALLFIFRRLGGMKSDIKNLKRRVATVENEVR